MCFRRKPKEENLVFDVPKADVMEYLGSYLDSKDKSIRIDVIENTEDVLHFDLFANIPGLHKELHVEYNFKLFEENNQTRVEIEVNGDNANAIRKDFVKKLNKKFNSKKK